MMKQWTAMLLAALLILLPLAGCTRQSDEESTPPGGEEVGGEAAAPDPTVTEHPLDGNPERVVAELNRFLESQELTESHQQFDEEYICHDFGTLTLYRTTRINGWNLIVAYREETGEYRWVDLGEYGLYRVTGAAPLHHNPGILRVYAESQVFGGDYIFTNLPATIYYSLEEGRVIETTFSIQSGTYGMFSGRDRHRFRECRVSGTEAVFSFAWTEGGDGNGYDAPEVLIETPYRDENQNATVFGFRDTAGGLDDEVLRRLGEMEGVADVQAEYVENGLFAGTLLTVTPLPDYRVVCDFHQGGGFEMTEFSLRCVQVTYHQPDFSNHLGFALELPPGTVMESGSVYDSRYATMELTDGERDELRLEVSGSPVDALSRFDYRDQGEIETSYTEVEAVPVTLYSDGEGGYEAHWYREDYHLSLFVRQEGLEEARWLELVSEFVSGCQLTVSQ